MTALILLDFQQDFFEFGTTPAHHADANLIQLANRLISAFPLSAAINDAHPANHHAFAANHLWRRPWQTIKIDGKDTLLWPMHAVKDSFGAEAPPGLHSEKLARSFEKGTETALSGFSAFENPDFKLWLQEEKVTQLICIGTLLEYSVLNTAIDAVNHGIHTTVIPEACGFLELQAGEKEKSIQIMLEKGVQIAAPGDFLNPQTLP